MAQATLFLFFLVLAASASTFKAQVAKECEYEMVVSTGPLRGPTYKLLVIIEAIGGENINTTNVIKQWGNMGRRYAYFLPNSADRFRTQRPCLKANFCNILIRGGKKEVELKPHWYINNITVATTGEGGINRLKTFRFLSENEFKYTNPPVNEGECP